MRLVLVHGINQQGLVSDTLKGAWLAALRAAAGRADAWPMNRLSGIDMPYYGDVLFAHTEDPGPGVAVSQGADEADDGFAEFADEAFKEMALKIGATEAEIDVLVADPVVAEGAGVHKKWLKAVARAVEAVSPLKGRLALRVLRQAHTYLKLPAAARDVDDLVRPHLDHDEPMIVVAHSLGTIVTFKLLREFAEKGRPRRVPLYVTLGSPLGIDVVRRSFAKPRKRPADVARWLNGADPEDFVALRPALTEANFGSGIENIPDIDNQYADPHSITDYLSDARIAKAIADAIDS